MRQAQRNFPSHASFSIPPAESKIRADSIMLPALLSDVCCEGGIGHSSEVSRLPCFAALVCAMGA